MGSTFGQPEHPGDTIEAGKCLYQYNSVLLMLILPGQQGMDDIPPDFDQQAVLGQLECNDVIEPGRCLF